MAIFTFPNCDCCGGGSSSSGGGGGTISTNCCPSALLATTLTATIETCDTSCYAVQTCTLTWDAVNSWWQGSVTFFNNCRSYSETVTLRFQCIFSISASAYVFTLGYTCNLSPAGSSSTQWTSGSFTCSPLSVPFSIDSAAANCCKTFDSSTYHITITS